MQKLLARPMQESVNALFDSLRMGSSPSSLHADPVRKSDNPRYPLPEFIESHACVIYVRGYDGVVGVSTPSKIWGVLDITRNCEYLGTGYRD